MHAFFTRSFGTVASLAVALSLLAPTGAFAQTSRQAMPTCAAGDPVVWENTSSKSKVYHMQGTKYYGTTKHGTYACKSAAEAAGFHAAKMSGHMGSMDSGTMGSSSTMPAAGASAAPSGMMGKHHRRHHGAKASPAPSPTA
jgi:hypothetical protein